MTQARTPAGAGSEYIVDSTQIPADVTWDTIPSVTNNLRDGIEVLQVRSTQDSTADFVWTFTAQDNGRIEGLRYENGTTALDSTTNGWEFDFINIDNSNESLAYFGIGLGTEAAKATDTTTVLASGFAELTNSATTGFNKGDKVQVTADRDGTLANGGVELVVSYESAGR